MKQPHLLFWSLILATFLYCCSIEPTLFEMMSPGQTGIHFSNRIIEDDTFNILSYEYVYNGGGVGVGDFDADGKEDLFFTGNRTGNRLYLNRGDFRFEEVTEVAGVEARDRWNSGVAVVDINNDGWLDLYVCATTYNPGTRRANALYISNGVAEDGRLTFTESAAAYGIADQSHTTNAAFFDYDNDGDLDLYLLINQMDENAIPTRYRKKIEDGTSHRTDKLLRNDFNPALGHPVFTDVSEQAGILIEGFGLGLNICDINRDGWKDIYISNDYLTNDLLWINQGANGQKPVTFKNEAAAYFKHTSYSAMGNDVVDLNNDGLVDVVALDMLPEDNLRRKTMLTPNNYTSYLNNERYGYQYQYVRNTLQLNRGKRPDNGQPLFSELAMYAGISGTDWSWTPLIADYDHDGLRDIIITNGFPNDITDRDFIDYNTEVGQFASMEHLLDRIPSVKISNYAYRNLAAEGSDLPEFEQVNEDWGFQQRSFSNGAVYADLDNDGDLDVVMNNINDSAFVYRNRLIEEARNQAHWLKIRFRGGPFNVNGLGATAEIHYDHGQRQFWDNTPYRGYLSSVNGGAHFGVGSVSRIDSVIILWQEGKREILRAVPVDQVLEVNIDNAVSTTEPYTVGNQVKATALFEEVTAEVGIDYTHPESDLIDFNAQPLLLHKLSQYGPGLAVSDINGDGLDDLYLGGSHFHKGQFFVQQPDGKFSVQDLLPGPDGSDKREEELGILFFDADNDNDQDLYLVSGGYGFDITDTSYQDRLFFNEDGRFVLRKRALPSFLSSGSCVKAADYDQDGDLDLFVGGRVWPFQYPRPVTSYLLANDGQGNFSIANDTSAPGLNDLGMICDALWTDFDNDGWVDLLLAGEWMPLRFLKNDRGKFKPHASENLDRHTGFWSSLAAADFDLDGDIDYVAGNLGTNTLLRATYERPISVYYADFDLNRSSPDGSPSSQRRSDGLDVLPAAFFPDERGVYREYPFFGRPDMEKQLIAVKKLYARHHDFGKTEMKQILAAFPEVEAEVVRANYGLSSYIENKGNGSFEIYPLPREAQIAPVYGMVAGDFDGDAVPDLILNGNDYGTEVGMGRYDALNGLFLAGDGSGGFKAWAMQQSGILIPGDGKGLVELMNPDGQRLMVAGQNRGPVKVFAHKGSSGDVVVLAPMDRLALISLEDGRSYQQELYYGHSFLSQSSRKLWLPAEVATVEIEDYQGNRRKIGLR